MAWLTGRVSRVFSSTGNGFALLALDLSRESFSYTWWYYNSLRLKGKCLTTKLLPIRHAYKDQIYDLDLLYCGLIRKLGTWGYWKSGLIHYCSDVAIDGARCVKGAFTSYLSFSWILLFVDKVTICSYLFMQCLFSGAGVITWSWLLGSHR